MRLSRLVPLQLLAFTWVAVYEVMIHRIGLGWLTYAVIAATWIYTVYALAKTNRHMESP